MASIDFFDVVSVSVSKHLAGDNRHSARWITFSIFDENHQMHTVTVFTKDPELAFKNV